MSFGNMYQVNHTPTRQPGLLQRAENSAPRKSS
jgi:hypothetical protein